MAGRFAMTLDNYLHSGHGYDEVIVVDRNGNELTSWQDDDPKYSAMVLDVKAKNHDTTVQIMIDYEKGN